MCSVRWAENLRSSPIWPQPGLPLGVSPDSRTVNLYTTESPSRQSAKALLQPSRQLRETRHHPTLRIFRSLSE